MPRFSLIATLAACLAFGIFLVFSSLANTSIDQLVETALHGAADDQLKATRELTTRGQDALPGMRQVLKKSHNDNVTAICILGVSKLRDYESMETILTKLNDESLTVRSAAAKAAIKMIGRDYHFPINGNKIQRASLIEKIAADWNEYKGSPLFEHNKERFK